jgi:drug/metabolite transporter (DMT)-like permease
MIAELLSVTYGILSMMSFGFSDFLSKKTVERVGYYRLVTYSQLVALAPVILLAVAYTPIMPSSATAIVLVIASGACSFSALFLFYRGLEVGRASIITPVFSAYAIVAILLSFAALGEVLTPLQIACIALTLIGVITISVRPDPTERSNSGIPYAVGAMFSAGVGAVLIKLVADDIGEIGSLFFNRTIAVLALVVVGALFLRSHLRLGVGKEFPVMSILLIGLTEFVAIFTFVVGVTVGMVSIVSTLSSASPVVTVVLAQTFLRERLDKIHKLAVAAVILGILFLSVAST